MKALYDLPAPAKLNLFLHVTGRRADGYHLLQSVFMLIDWCDVLHVERRDDGVLSREDLGAVLPADDLILRAGRALQAAAGTSQGAHIAVDKRLPTEAGLGGGSSDAATCLLALNRLWDLNFSLSSLERIGLSLGADVPFFLRGRNAWVEGIGEEITPVPLSRATFAVVKPKEGIQTGLIFTAPDLRRDSPAAIISGFAAHSEACVDGTPFDYGRNDLQPVAERLCPSVTAAIDWLGCQGFAARMTGSGSSVFAAVPHDAQLAAPPSDWQVRKCSNLDVHPLVGWAD
ncbi:MAG: 4-(cytidine 5'-diphospho)-2-C-methyl-D-erythritol kinase [Gammaproteobacteria bacterium]|nr:4-(cytidine 5'-diphospho)-2-C-methyl-D-erythritol kinase [Gammaproteobacteria bacterium]MBU1442611.1 4-(cytidine 5'-diphospho)-2-C-methyl-D-erythritol kinase [Gammaproteobacteria bacterium]MBU2286920.1 4-(cytidine 5'-diphospho)-2-C-methyl-D-erythritol kinase [Gammaproteobacteria bacterium]